MANKIRVVCTAAALVPLALLAACGSSGTSTTATSPSASSTSGIVSLTETGSTLMFPLFGAWQTAYNKTVTNVNLTTAGTGSGTGIADAASGVVNMGASDAYLSSAEMSQNHNLLNIPLAVSSAMISYNVPGVGGHLKFNGPVLTGIYSGKITKWNDPAIAKINPGVKLPSMNIVTLHRSDSSGTTFIYTSYLNAQDSVGWPAAQVGTTVSWPKAPGALAELGNVQAALSQFAPLTPANESQSLINTSNPKGYPIINYEYVVVNKKQSSAAVASAMKAFLNWTLTTGNSATFLTPVYFEPLPATVKALSQTQISSIGG